MTIQTETWRYPRIGKNRDLKKALEALVIQVNEPARLDADVLSIENSQSGNQTLEEIATGGYRHQVGNGVYDIHSPIIPNPAGIVQQLGAGLTKLPLQIWVNPECELKTRRWSEVISALKNMVQAAKVLREEADANPR